MISTRINHNKQLILKRKLNESRLETYIVFKTKIDEMYLDWDVNKETRGLRKCLDKPWGCLRTYVYDSYKKNTVTKYELWKLG